MQQQHTMVLVTSQQLPSSVVETQRWEHFLEGMKIPFERQQVDAINGTLVLRQRRPAAIHQLDSPSFSFVLYFPTNIHQ